MTPPGFESDFKSDSQFNCRSVGKSDVNSDCEPGCGADCKFDCELDCKPTQFHPISNLISNLISNIISNPIANPFANLIANTVANSFSKPEQVKTLSEVLSRSCHFLATPSLHTQALALACMRDCVLKLASAGADAGERLRSAHSIERVRCCYYCRSQSLHI